MFKKWIHIILSVWLINSVTYVHASYPADFFSSNSHDDACFKVNTWADCILQSITDDASPDSGKAHKVKFQRRYVRVRSFNDSIFLSAPHLSVQYQQLYNAVADKVGNYTIGVALLPAYYKFLFRLSPF